jgi:hypothetical protein
MTVIGIKYGARTTQLKSWSLTRKSKPLGGTSIFTFHISRLLMPNEQKEGKAGDSLKIQVEDGQVTLDWDRNDPMWNFLNNLTQEQLQEFVNESIEHGLSTTDLSGETDAREGDGV